MHFPGTHFTSSDFEFLVLIPIGMFFRHTSHDLVLVTAIFGTYPLTVSGHPIDLSAPSKIHHSNEDLDKNYVEEESQTKRNVVRTLKWQYFI